MQKGGGDDHDDAKVERGALRGRHPADPFPLTPLQEGMLFHHLSDPGAGVDVEQIVLDFPGPVDPGALRSAWDRLCQRYPRLGVRFLWEGLDRPLQLEGPAQAEIGVEVLAEEDPAEARALMVARMEQDRYRPFELREPNLVRVRLYRLPEGGDRITLTFPHILMDGRSFPQVTRDLVLELLRPGATASFPPVPSFRDFVHWLHGREEEQLESDRAFWCGYLAGSEVEAPPRATARGASGERREVERVLDHGGTARLRDLAMASGVGIGAVVQAAWGLLLARTEGTDDLLFGVVRTGRPAVAGGEAIPGAGEDGVGVFINALPFRFRTDGVARLGDLLREVGRSNRSIRPHEYAPLVQIQKWSGRAGGEPLFETLHIHDHGHLDDQLRQALQAVVGMGVDGGGGEEGTPSVCAELVERTPYPITLYSYDGEGLRLRLAHDTGALPEVEADDLADRLLALLEAMQAGPETPLLHLDALLPAEREAVLERWNDTARSFDLDTTLHARVFERLREDTGRIAVSMATDGLSAGELDRLSARLAGHLAGLGVGPGDLVGVALPRSTDQVVTLLAVLRLGAAYLPLDPSYPEERLSFMVEDSKVKIVVTSQTGEPAVAPHRVPSLRIDEDREAILAAPPFHEVVGEAADRAYLIYTSGSTGRPKGVEVEHRNVLNFLDGMDEVLSPVDGTGPGKDPTAGAWLSLTSLSFDISILELFWPLTRGMRLVLDPGAVPGAEPGARAVLREKPGEREGSSPPDVSSDGLRPNARAQADPGSIPTPGAGTGSRPMEMSLFYFSADAGTSDPGKGGTEGVYRLLLEGARFADREGFSAVWTPERHFHAFGGLYPSPAVTGAAVAAITTRVGIRAGSVVLPLHHPVRVAEDWSVVDNLSGGRVGLSLASGWHPDDFLLAPGNHAERRDLLFRNAELVRRLWRGEALEFPGPDGKPVEVRTLPRPVQPELPLWITTAGNVETYREAGTLGARVLTHLLGQTMEEVEERVAAYHAAWREAGNEGRGHVSLMLHTFVGTDVDEVREVVREPMKAYLRTSVGLIRNVADAWTAYRRKPGAPPVARGDEFTNLPEEDLDALLDFAFERYFQTAGLFGTPEACVALARRLQGAGVDEIACLVDFGVEAEKVLAHLPYLAEVRRALAGEDAPVFSRSNESSPGVAGDERGPLGGVPILGDLIETEGVSHIQCTPSQLRMILADRASREALGKLSVFLVGGEAFPSSLAHELLDATPARVINMYGPTETTIWSTFHELPREGRGVDGPVVPIGRPIANTVVRVVGPGGALVAPGKVGELYVGGSGVARGYLGRRALTEERFLPDPWGANGGARMYRTGDLASFREDGALEFHGRADNQVKLRGHRIESGEIEAVLESLPEVRQAVVMLREDTPGDPRLAAYLVPAHPAPSLPELREELRRRLPAIMVPSSLTILEAFPLTPNRKVDRNALPSPSTARSSAAFGERPTGHGAVGPLSGSAGAGGHAAAGKVMTRLGEIWKDLLGLETVAPNDNFFDLGGHSLLTVQVHGRIREVFGRDLRITDLFRYPTLRTLAGFLSEDPTPGPEGRGSEGSQQPVSTPSGADGRSGEEGSTADALGRGARRRKVIRGRSGGSER